MARVSATVSAPAAPARTADLFAPGLRGLTIGLVSTITLVALESLAIGTVMPMVAEELGDLPLYGWVYTAFFLGSLIGIVLAGGVLDRMPLQRPFAVGLGLFGLGLAIGGLAPSMPVLIAARFLQGLGGGALAPTAYVAIGRCLPERLQPRMFAMLSTAWVVPGILGPVAGGRRGRAGRLALGVPGAHSRCWPWPAGWRSTRCATCPPPRSPPRATGRARRATCAASAQRWPRPRVRACSSPAWERPIRSCWSPARSSASRSSCRRTAGSPRRGRCASPRACRPPSSCAALMTFSFFAADAYIALLLQTWRGTPAALTGVVFTVTTIAWTLGTWTQARRIDRYGPRRFVALGFACIAVGGLLTLPVVVAGAPPEITIVTWAIPGIGMGFMYSAVTLVVLRGVEASEQGSASSSLQLSDILGTALGAGVAGAITAAGTRAGPEGLGPALAAVFALSIGVGGAGRARVAAGSGPSPHPRTGYRLR